MVVRENIRGVATTIRNHPLGTVTIIPNFLSIRKVVVLIYVEESVGRADGPTNIPTLRHCCQQRKIYKLEHFSPSG